jgi:disulfide bond formation protein DsbB
MQRPDGLGIARGIALLVPLALLGGAWGSQLIGGLIPCEMCHWQRWPHYAALAVAILAFVAPGRGLKLALVLLAGLLIGTSGAIGVFHAGVEYHWWPGITACTAPITGGGDFLSRIQDGPMIRCDKAQWELFGVSLAGFNALFSLAAALAILIAAPFKPRTAK